MARPRSEPARPKSGLDAFRLSDEELHQALVEIGDPDPASEMRRIAREEIARLCDHVVRRTHDRPGATMRVELSGIFAEALTSFSADDEPGGPDAA